MRPQAWAAVPKLAVPWLGKTTSPSCSARPGRPQTSQNAAVRSPRGEGLPRGPVYCQPFQHWRVFQAAHGHVRALQQFGFMISARRNTLRLPFPQKPHGICGISSLLEVYCRYCLHLAPAGTPACPTARKGNEALGAALLGWPQWR